MQEGHVIGVPFDHVAVGGLGKGLGVGDAVGVHEAHHLGGYGAAFHERLAQAFEAAEVPELEFHEAPPVVLPGDAVHAHGQPRAGVGLVGAFRAGELHPSALLIHGPFLRPAFQVGVDVHVLAVVAPDGRLPERVGGFPYPCRDVFRERVEVDGFLGYDLHGRAHRVAFDHIAGQREQAQPLLGVVVVEDVARHDEVLVALRDHGAVPGRFDVGKHGLFDAREGLFDLGAEFLVRVLLFPLHDQIVHPQPKARLVRGEHGQEELGGEVGHAVGPDALVQGGEFLPLREVVGRDEVGDGQPGAAAGAVEVGRAVLRKLGVAGFGGAFGREGAVIGEC